MRHKKYNRSDGNPTKWERIEKEGLSARLNAASNHGLSARMNEYGDGYWVSYVNRENYSGMKYKHFGKGERNKAKAQAFYEKMAKLAVYPINPNTPGGFASLYIREKGKEITLKKTKPARKR